MKKQEIIKKIKMKTKPSSLKDKSFFKKDKKDKHSQTKKKREGRQITNI